MWFEKSSASLGGSDEAFCWQTGGKAELAFISSTAKRQQNCTTVFTKAIRDEEAKKHLSVDIQYSSNSRGLGPHYIRVPSSTSARLGRQKLWAHRATAIPLKSPSPFMRRVFPPLGSARPRLSLQERLNKPTPASSFYFYLFISADNIGLFSLLTDLTCLLLKGLS